MADIVVLAFSAALNPTLLAASTMMMLLPNPVRLMLGYLLGALTMSITLGLVIVFTLEGSGAVATTQHTLSPVATMLLGGLSFVLAFVLGTGRHRRDGARRRFSRRTNREQRRPRWQEALSKGSARITFVVGALLTLPGASYLVGLSRIDKLDHPPALTVLLVVGFNLIMLGVLEVSLLCFVFAPDWTPAAIERTRARVMPHIRTVAVIALTVLGSLLVTKGLIELLI